MNIKHVDIHNLADCTEQEVFDFIANHLLTQNRQSVNENGRCLYRYENLKCAAGCLIPDSDYSFGLEGTDWRGVRDRLSLSFAHSLLILSLQNLHDTYPVEDWKPELKHLALLHDLEWKFS